MRRSSRQYLFLCLAVLTAVSVTAQTTEPLGRQYSISLSSGRTFYRDGLQYGLGPGQSIGLDVGTALNDKFTLGVALGVDQLDLGGHLGIHGVHYGYTTLYDDDDYGAKYHGLGYGLIAGARYRISPRFDVIVRVDAGHASSILASWYYRTHLGVTWRI